MKTRLMFPVSSDEHAGRSLTIDVVESFDEVLDRVAPLNPAMSALEARARATWTTPEGKRVYVQPGAILMVREMEDDE